MALTEKPRGRLWQRLHFLVLFVLVTGVMIAGTGLVIAAQDGLLTAVQLRASWASFLSGGGLPLSLWLLLGGGLAVVLMLLIELIGGLRLAAARRSAFGLNAGLQVVLALVLLVGVNAYAFLHPAHFDWTGLHWKRYLEAAAADPKFPLAQSIRVQGGKFTLPEGLRKQLSELRGETTIVVYQRHRTFGRLSDDKPDARDYAAERKVVEKVHDLVDQFRQLGSRFRVVVLDVEEEGFEDRLAKETKDAPELREAIDGAQENSIFFYAPGDAGRKGSVQRLAFNDFYQLDKTASKQQGNLVLLYQGVEPFARKVLSVDEKKPRIGIATIHEVLTTEGQGDYGLGGLKKALTANGFEVRDLVLKKWSRMRPPEPAVYTYEESKLDRIEGRLQILDRAIAGMEKAQKELTELQAFATKATLDDLTKRYAAQLRGRRVTEAMRRDLLDDLADNLEAVNAALDLNRKRRDEVKVELAGLNVEELDEQRRMSDLQAKFARMLADCDLLIVPRMTLRNVTSDFDNIPYRVYRLDDAQVNAIKDFLKSGKPVLACIGPANEPPDVGGPPEGGPDGIETLLEQAGIKLGKQTVLYDVESESFADRRAGFQVAGTSVKVPPVEFDWKPGALKFFGRDPSTAAPPNRLRDSLRIASRSVGKPLELDMRYPRPAWYEIDRAREAGAAVAALGTVPEAGILPGVTLAAVEFARRQAAQPRIGPEFMFTSRDSWNEEQPFPSGEREPRFEPPKADDPTRGTADEKRRGPFPIGVAIETTVPGSWYDRLTEWPPRVRIAAIGQGTFLTGTELTPAKEKFLLDTSNWLLGRDDRLPRDERVWSYPRVDLDERDKALWHWGTQLGLPALFLYLGTVVLLVRRMR